MKLFTILIALFFSSYQNSYADKMGISKRVFGEIEGQIIHEYTLRNNKGMQVKLMSYGATITDIITPDKNGRLGSVVFGFDSLSGYVGRQNALAGSIVGRVANRINGGKFQIESKEYKLSANIHGGKQGFDKKIWTVEELKNSKGVALKMSYFSKDGEEGYPGNLKVEVIYTLTDKNELTINYHATTDQATHVNLTNHSYFNLSGGSSETISDIELRILSNKYLEANGNNIPSGRMINVTGTPFDFTSFQPIGKRIADDHPALKMGNGYDLTYALSNQTGSLKLAAEACDPQSGRMLKAYSTEPGLVFYTANHMNPGIIGRGQKPSIKYAAFCLEFQHYPDSPNQPEFPTTLLMPGAVYQSSTVFSFSVR